MMENGVKTKAWMKGLLVASLLVNVGLAGAYVGNFWRHKGPETRDMGLGPVAHALTAEQRKDYRTALMAQLPDLKQGRESLRADFDALQSALKQQPYNEAEVDKAMALLFQRTQDRLKVSQQLLVTIVKDMSESERLNFAEKLADVFRRAPKG